MCGYCAFKKLCKYKHSTEIFIRELQEMREDYNLPNLDTETICKDFKEEE